MQQTLAQAMAAQVMGAAMRTSAAEASAAGASRVSGVDAAMAAYAEQELQSFAARKRLAPATEAKLRTLPHEAMLSIIQESRSEASSNVDGTEDVLIMARIAKTQAGAAQTQKMPEKRNLTPVAKASLVNKKADKAAISSAGSTVARSKEEQKAWDEVQKIVKSKIAARGHTLDFAQMIVSFAAEQKLPKEAEQALLMMSTAHVLLIVKGTVFTNCPEVKDKMKKLCATIQRYDDKIHDLLSKMWACNPENTKKSDGKVGRASKSRSRKRSRSRPRRSRSRPRRRRRSRSSRSRDRQRRDPKVKRRSSSSSDSSKRPAAKAAASIAPKAAEVSPVAAAEAGSSGNDELVQPQGETEVAMWNWLKGLDGGRGSLLHYFAAIKSEFDADFQQLAATRLQKPVSPGALGSIEPSFFEALGVKSVGHRLLFARGIMKLSASKP